MTRWTPSVIVVHALLGLAAMVVAAPLVWMLLLSFGLPGPPTLVHYRTLFERVGVGRALANSAGLALAVTAISLVLNTLAGEERD